MISHGGAVPMSPHHLHAVRSTVTGEWIRPSYCMIEGKGVKTARDRALAIKYAPEQVPMILRWLGAGWEAEPEVDRK